MTLVFLILCAALVGLAIYINIQPDSFKVTRNALVSGSPAEVFDQVNTLKNWNAWSPWARMDPNAKNTFEGPESGVDAAMSWAGNKTVGEGKMTITESRPNERVKFRLEFFKPFRATNTAEFSFAPEGSGTRVTWSMSGPKNFIAKGMHLMMDCDKMVGGQFEDGLRNMGEVLKKAA
jgi:hypothetical protein